MTERKHTALPWNIRYEGQTLTNKPNGVFRIDGPSGLPLANVHSPKFDRTEGRVNAEFMVRACNAHYELLEALEALVNAHDEQPPMLTEAEWQQARAATLKAKH